VSHPVGSTNGVAFALLPDAGQGLERMRLARIVQVEDQGTRLGDAKQVSLGAIRSKDVDQRPAKQPANQNELEKSTHPRV